MNKKVTKMQQKKKSKVKKSRKRSPEEDNEWEVTDIVETTDPNALPSAVDSSIEEQNEFAILPDKAVEENAELVLAEDPTSSPKKKRKKRGPVERSEASLNISEFNLNEVGKEKVQLSDLVKSSQKLAGQTEIKKQLEKVKKLKTLPIPLTKPEVQRIKRTAAYEKVCDEVSKWDSVVESNRVADQIIYPLKKPQVSIESFDKETETFVTKHPVEIAVNELLNKSENVIDSKKPFTEAEQKILDAMSPEEAKLRMQELMKQRALMSYQQVKACRQNKIKSKKYRRLLKKEKMKKLVKEFEELEKVDAAAALEKVMEADKLRVLERVTLKHRNTGKWAKIQKLRAKYNPDARDVLKEDLIIGKQLKEKLPSVQKAITRLTTTLEQQDDEEDDEKFVEEALLDEKPDPLTADEEKGTEPDISDKWLVNPASLLDKATVKKHLGGQKVKGSASTKAIEKADEFVDMESITKSNALDSCKAINVVDGDDLDGQSEAEDDESDAEPSNGVKSVSEAFADEDLIAEFREEKNAQNKKPKGIDLYLPGWGSWTGPNIKASEKKRKRFFFEIINDISKKNTLGSVILNEERDKKVSSLQVSTLPFPFKNVTAFESHMRQPLGQTWNPQSSFQDLNAPKVIVKAGKIIDPIDADDVLLAETKKDTAEERLKKIRTDQLPLEAF